MRRGTMRNVVTAGVMEDIEYLYGLQVDLSGVGV